MKKSIVYLSIVLMMFIFNGCDDKKHTELESNSLSNIVMDDAFVLYDKPELMEQYRDYNNQMLKDFDIDFRIITTTSDEDLNIFSNKAFTSLQKKSRSKSGKALLLVVNTSQDKVRLEVSLALEPIYTDALVSYVERKGMVPYFQDNKIADGVFVMTALARDRAYEASQGKEFMAPMQSQSIGGGAKTDAKIGQINPNAKNGAAVASDIKNSPKDVLKKYLHVLTSHNRNPNLDIYTDKTKAFFRKWTITEIAQNNEYLFVSKCNDGKKTLYSKDNQYAILINDVEKRRNCTPYYFKKENGSWKLDFWTMSKVLLFNTSQHWHFNMKAKDELSSAYNFAFGGFFYDNNGYPYYGTLGGRKKFRWGFSCHKYYEPNMPKIARCRIRRLLDNGFAKNILGLKTSDVITEISDGSRSINPTIGQFLYYIDNAPVGANILIKVKRKNEGIKVLQAIAP